MARPAASSLALFTRRPLDSRCSEVLRALCEELMFLCVLSDGRLVLMIDGMVSSSQKG